MELPVFEFFFILIMDVSISLWAVAIVFSYSTCIFVCLICFVICFEEIPLNHAFRFPAMIR